MIREHIIDAPRNDPPVRSLLDYTILSVDGGPVAREKIPPLVDEQPGALIPAGTHELRARVQPHRLPPNYFPKEITFQVTVESGKAYFLVDDNDARPALIKIRPLH